MKAEDVKKRYKRIENHIMKAEFGEAIQFLREFFEQFNNNDREIRRQLALITARYNMDLRSNVLGTKEDSKEINRIIDSLLQILDDANDHALANLESDSTNDSGLFARFGSMFGNFNPESIAKLLTPENINQFWTYLTPKMRAIILEKYILEIKAKNIMDRSEIISVFDLSEEELTFIETKNKSLLKPEN